MKTINRKELLNFISSLAQTQEITQQVFCGKNIYFLSDKINDFTEEKFQVEFISQTKKYFFTLLIRGTEKESDFMHPQIVKYLKSKNLGRNIIIDTEQKTTLI